jgi:hypothetical protein
MLDTLSNLVIGLVELVAGAVHWILKRIFGLKPEAERPGWVRALAILLIVGFAIIVLGLAFAFFVTAFYVLVVIASIGAVIGLLGLN